MCYNGLQGVRGVTRGYKGYRGLQRVTRGYNYSHANKAYVVVTGDYKGLQGIRGSYRW